jgi:IS4 transposase
MMLIFRLVSSKNAQSYGTTIDDLWDSCDRLKLSLPQKSSIAPSSFCAARKKLDESIFQCVNRKILTAYSPERDTYLWRGHRLFGVDGTKINLPRKLVSSGYRTPSKQSYYPQGLVSCLYEIRSRLPFDFDLVSHSDERRCARKHLDTLVDNDVVVYDRGYFSYAMLHQHSQTGIHAIFRLQESSNSVIREFFASKETDSLVTISPSGPSKTYILKKHPNLDIIPLKMRLLKYEILGTTFCLGTTLIDPHQQYPIQDFMEVYHSRWGVEELYKVSKRVFTIEDFHAKTERGVKQELFAHFVLISMNRLFANQADLELNGEDAHTPPLESTEQDPSIGGTSKIQTNFKNCIHVLQRSLDEFLLLEHKMTTAVQRAFDSIVHQYQKARPGRSYPRKSRKPETRWIPAKEKRKQRNRELAPAATS